ncbi:RagB/SusD domain protein [Paludibacter propionicigenes WB4]|uniref:RagB/SusD domain protein n=1 Tax=Paludibacter propionicigenes (strain DSM 17365 / JCM 13257 / WB4) TaxID=694427 RepID=E4T7F1_PALPW|nr:RagB/SusD family nutrient uptake outer membrane protein [Paludibacter propionicigenes]ADQ80645.1 RagB/SusD domain protein [Paludibacter propionicigenes WB4]
MKTKYIFSIFFLAVFMALPSCKSFVEENPKGQMIPENTEDYRYLLNYSAVFVNGYGNNEFGTDDIDLNQENVTGILSGIESSVNYYTFKKDLFTAALSDEEWTFLYQQVFYCNVVLTEVMNSKNGTDAEKNELYAEALVHRAYAYWVLVNQYSKMYNASTAATDAGVPMPTEPVINKNLTRASVKTVYDAILKDVLYAAEILPNKQPNKLYPSKAAAYALLSRIYLIMDNYSQSAIYAEKTLSIQDSLTNLNDFVDDPSLLPRKIANPELLIIKNSSFNVYALPFRLSEDLLNTYTDGDLRYQLLIQDGQTGANIGSLNFDGKAFVRSKLNGEDMNTGLTIPEVYLNLAECYARLGDMDKSLHYLNKLLVNRYSTDSFTDVTATSKEELLATVLLERRKELLGNGMRWFDLRRLNKEPQFAKTVTHIYRGTSYTLEPNSANYIFPIDTKVIKLNPEITQNERN